MADSGVAPAGGVPEGWAPPPGPAHFKRRPAAQLRARANG